MLCPNDFQRQHWFEKKRKIRLSSQVHIKQRNKLVQRKGGKNTFSQNRLFCVPTYVQFSSPLVHSPGIPSGFQMTSQCQLLKALNESQTRDFFTAPSTVHRTVVVQGCSLLGEEDSNHPPVQMEEAWITSVFLQHQRVFLQQIYPSIHIFQFLNVKKLDH